jgi:hypothetical protein
VKNRIAHLLAQEPAAVATVAAEPEPTRVILVWGRGGANGALRRPILDAIEAGHGLPLLPGDPGDWAVRLVMKLSAFNAARRSSPCVVRWEVS